MTSADYFDRLYDDNPDPWDLAASPYERRKLALLLAALPRPRYHNAFEPGCAIGVTTAALADRCDRLIAMDGAAAAVTQVRARVSSPHVVVCSGRVPADWPDGRFDLIVISELLYFLDEEARLGVAARVGDSLLPGGDVIAVHWRHSFAEAPANGDLVHAELAARFRAAGLTLTVDHTEEHFLLQAYRRVASEGISDPRHDRPAATGAGVGKDSGMAP
ncbi:MAG: hypothetical protein QOI06_333 [Nocardioidaceae bacterium]|jgi:trans-aconitate methyltransferase|nr:hypothetical protein [Nocardioidaceae bacterium]